MPAKDESGIGAAETEAVRHHTVKVDVVDATEGDRHVGEGGVKLFDVGALTDETAVHHEQRKDGFLNADCAERVPGQRLGRGDRRNLASEDLADRLDLADIADRRAGAVWIYVANLRYAPAIEALEG